MFSNFKSGENYGFYLKWLGFAEEKPHRFNEIHVIYTQGLVEKKILYINRVDIQIIK